MGTTPPGRQLPILALLVALACYFFACYWPALEERQPAWVQEHPWVWWMGNWQMFTLLDTGQSLVVAERRVDGAWSAIELEALFPTRWESGPRYARSSFFNNPHNLAVLGAATCGRLPQRPERVRFFRLTWAKRLGRLDRVPPRKVKRRELLEWDCAQTVALPTGRRL